MSGSTIRRLAIWLSIALSFTTLMVILGRTGNEVDPTITSSKPSGLRLLSELLETNGIEVKQNRNQIPQLLDSEVSIALLRVRDGKVDWPGEELQFQDRKSTIRSNLASQVKKGHRLILVYVNDDFNRSSIALTSPISVQNAMLKNSPIYAVDGNPSTMEELFPLGYEPATRDALSVWQSSTTEQPLVSYEVMGKGLIVHVHDGIGLTNRFLDQHQNAAFYLQLVKSVAGDRSSVTFTEASFGNIADDGLISALGGWARSAVWQGFLLFGVIAWSFAIGFGLPIVDRRRQSGTRDLMEAMNQLLKRAKNRPMAMQQVFHALESDLKRSVGLPRSANQEALQQRVPVQLFDKLQRVKGQIALSGGGQSLAELDELRREVRDFGRSRKAPSRMPERMP